MKVTHIHITVLAYFLTDDLKGKNEYVPNHAYTNKSRHVCGCDIYQSSNPICYVLTTAIFIPVNE